MDAVVRGRLSAADLLDRLRQTRLRGHGGAQPYQSAALTIERGMDPRDLVPAQNYVLLPGVRQVLALRAALLTSGVDVFDLDGAAFIESPQTRDEVIPVLPPVVEESHEPDGRTVLLINDGMHRVYAALRLGLPITVVLARGVPPELPYYAYALEGGWDAVTPLDDLPEVHQKKNYREPDSYKALFREFNAVFPGVQKQRKQTNPEHLAM